MRKITLQLLNPLLALLMLNQIATGVLGGMLSPGVFAVMHKGGGIVFAVGAILHVVLNWSWVRANFPVFRR